MAMDLQQRPLEHGHRRHHTRTETENGRVSSATAPPLKMGGLPDPPDRFLIFMAPRVVRLGQPVLYLVCVADHVEAALPRIDGVSVTRLLGPNWMPLSVRIV